MKMCKIEHRKRELLENVLKRADQSYRAAIQRYKRHEDKYSTGAILCEMQVFTSGHILGYDSQRIARDLKD